MNIFKSVICFLYILFYVFRKRAIEIGVLIPMCVKMMLYRIAHTSNIDILNI